MAAEPVTCGSAESSFDVHQVQLSGLGKQSTDVSYPCEAFNQSTCKSH